MPDPQPFRIAILGTGSIADTAHAPALSSLPECCLWSVLSRCQDRAQGFARRHQAKAPQAAFDDLAGLLRDDALDAVIVTTPDRLHAAMAIAALKAGKHVLVEKPMVTSRAEGEELLAARDASGKTLAVAFHLRHHRGHRLLRERILAGDIGEVRHLRVQWTFAAADASNWRATPKLGKWWSLAANGPHALDLVRWFAADRLGPLEELRGTFSRGRVLGSPHDETAVVGGCFASGATIEILTSVLFASRPAFEIYGSEGEGICRDTLGRHGAGDIELNGDPLTFEVHSPFAGEIADFVAAARDGRAPEVGGEAGMQVVEDLLRISDF
ncbi:MAG: Gfo/Idh/MocA family oxidoreductase [Planctomycetota bacterium]